tara:strand:- start:120 stop:1376 length:1257 start_codon:yes stop_codon:yes gene_type:complete
MAQQFVFKGVKEIRDYTSTDGTYTFSVKNDPRGGDTWQIPQWWNRKGNNTIYNSCTVFEMAGTPYTMIIPTSADTQLQVTWDGDVYNTIFSNFDSVERILFTDKSTKRPVIEYLLPAISGGAIAKRIVQAATTIGSFSVTGKGNVDVGNSTQYSQDSTPDADDVTYAWTVIDNSTGSVAITDKAEITSSSTGPGCTVSWKVAGSYGVKCVISSDTASDSPQEATRTVTAAVPLTVGTVEVTGQASPEQGLDYTYTATVTGNTVSDLAYDWSVADGSADVTNGNATSTINFTGTGNMTVQCLVTSESIADSDTGTKAVVVSAAKIVGPVTIEPAGKLEVDTDVATTVTAVDGGNVSDQTYQWSSTPSTGASFGTATAATTTVTYTTAGAYTLKVVVSSTSSQNGTSEQSKNVTVSDPTP